MKPLGGGISTNFGFTKGFVTARVINIGRQGCGGGALFHGSYGKKLAYEGSKLEKQHGKRRRREMGVVVQVEGMRFVGGGKRWERYGEAGRMCMAVL